MRAIPCTIQNIEAYGEICYLIDVNVQDITLAALELSALRASLISEVCFRDDKNRSSFLIGSNTIVLIDRIITDTSAWCDAVLSLFLNTALNGWSDTAHLDQTFPGRNDILSITIHISI